jgi:hypothetical protein
MNNILDDFKSRRQLSEKKKGPIVERLVHEFSTLIDIKIEELEHVKNQFDTELLREYIKWQDDFVGFCRDVLKIKLKCVGNDPDFDSPLTIACYIVWYYKCNPSSQVIVLDSRVDSVTAMWQKVMKIVQNRDFVFDEERASKFGIMTDTTIQRGSGVFIKRVLVQLLDNEDSLFKFRNGYDAKNTLFVISKSKWRKFKPMTISQNEIKRLTELGNNAELIQC